MLRATVLVKVGVSCRQAVPYTAKGLPVWGPYHMVHDSVVQLVDSTGYAEEWG